LPSGDYRGRLEFLDRAGIAPPSFFCANQSAHPESHRTTCRDLKTMNTPTASSWPKATLLALASAALAWVAGCAVEPGPFPALDSTKFTLENTDRFMPLDQAVQHSVTCTGLQEIPMADGRLEVVANVKNRENRRVQVQINCVFKDEQGFSTGDETP